MSYFLSAELSSHRRGRFLASVLDIAPLADNKLPELGFVLVTGESLQENLDKQRDYFNWAQKPGCTLLVLPPFREGKLFIDLDWSVGFVASPVLDAEPDSLAQLLSAEVLYQLDGYEGGSETTAGHLWSDHSSHTRYWKTHSNSGLLAATTLPLWSISLLNHAKLVAVFLDWFSMQTGKISSTDHENPQPATKTSLLPEDNTVLVCCFGLKLNSASQLLAAINQGATPFLNLSGFNLAESFERLHILGLMDEGGLTAVGTQYLQSSKYWGYAEHLQAGA